METMSLKKRAPNSLLFFVFKLPSKINFTFYLIIKNNYSENFSFEIIINNIFISIAKKSNTFTINDAYLKLTFSTQPPL